MNPSTCGTDDVMWTCRNVGGGKCNQWGMEPSAFYSDPAAGAWEQNDRARLVTARGETTYEEGGQCYLSPSAST